jgi:hypothetical protein
MLHNDLLFNLYEQKKERLYDEIRIILHNTSRAYGDYPYQKGYSVVCRCMISFHTVGNNNNKGKKDEANITSGWWCMCACMQT